MKIVSVRHIDGPNVYLYKPILMARIHLESYTEQESTDFALFANRLLTGLPGLSEHHCAKGAPGGFVERLYEGTYFGHIVEHVTLEMASLLGLDAHYGKTVYADGPGIYDIVMECQSFECQKFLLYAAARYVEQVSQGIVPHPALDTILDEARRVLQDMDLGPSTKAIVTACERRGIPVRRIGRGSLLELGYGVHRKRVCATITDNTSCVAADIACNKEETKMILRDGGIPVPDGVVVATVDEAVASWRSVSPTVVIKPKAGRQGQGVALSVTTEAKLRQAFATAMQFGSEVLIEEQVAGDNVRLLVAGGTCCAVSCREPAHVTGDGVHTIRYLIDAVNADERRGEDHEKPLTKIRVDNDLKSTLQGKGIRLTTVPAAGEKIVLKESVNLSTGAEARDITDDIHPSYKQLAERSARLIGLDVCGIDMMIEAIDEPATDQNCAVIEVNAAPGIRMHQHPSRGEPRDAGDFIVEALYPNRQQGRIPIISITGTNGKTTTTRLIASGLEREGRTVGVTTSSGVYIGGRKVADGDTTGPRSARLVLSDPTVETAVLETARGGIVRGGLAYDKADVAVLTNISCDHVGQDGIDTTGDLLHVKSLVAECVHDTGTVVLNADDDALVSLSHRLSVRLVLTSSKPDNPVVLEHLHRGGEAIYLDGVRMMEAHGNMRRVVGHVTEFPLTLGGTVRFHVENALLAAAAMRAAGMTRPSVAATLRAFTPDRNDGRCMIYQLPNGAHVILDYAHNPAGFARVGEWLTQLPHRKLIGIVGVPGDRCDQLVRDGAEVLSSVFHHFIVKEDDDKRGRESGEIATVIATAIRSCTTAKPIDIVLDEREALKHGVQLLEASDIACVFYERKAPLIDWIETNGGRLVTTIETRVARAYAML